MKMLGFHIILFLIMSPWATTAVPKSEHWQQVLWESGIKILSESTAPYILLNQVVQAIEAEDGTTEVKPVINEIFTRVLVLDSEKLRQSSGLEQSAVQTDRPNTITRLFGSVLNPENHSHNNTSLIQHTNDNIFDAFLDNFRYTIPNPPQRNSTDVQRNAAVGNHSKSSFTDSSDVAIIRDWLGVAQRRFRPLAGPFFNFLGEDSGLPLDGANKGSNVKVAQKRGIHPP